MNIEGAGPHVHGNDAIRNARMKWSFCFKLLHKLYAINVNAVSNADGFCGNERVWFMYVHICIYGGTEGIYAIALHLTLINEG